MRRPVALVLTAALALVACGDDGGDEEAGASTTTTEAAPPPTEADGSTSTGADGSSTTATTEADGSTTTAVDEGDLPGEPIDIYPYEGAHLGVVGVEAGDTLNVRSGPGTDFDVVTELGPLSQEPTATGRNRTLDDGSLWVEVTVGGETGWVNGAYVSQPGAVVDVTADVPAVSGETVVEVAEAVAAGRASAGEGPQPTVTVVAGPSADDDGGDAEEVTVDVLGLADDAQEGERLVVVAAPATGGTGYALVSVEAIALCARGVTEDLLCT